MPLSAPPPRFLAAMTALALGTAALAGCGGDDEEAEPGPPVSAVTIESDGLSFEPDTVTVRAGEEVTLTYDNQDQGILHNVHVRAPGEPKTEVAEGPDVSEVSFTLEEPGEHEFICDVHPTQMTGTLFVVEG